ncbi:triose-phosphate transporter family-domain-containing protein [Biscogniauxia mediterranea]|nr:triose-phosphate transporter family-domain-containing protein [Biscogniauxia mediterranea]
MGAYLSAVVFLTYLARALARTTTLLDSRHSINMTGHVYVRAVVPIGILYSCSIVSNNYLVYLYLSVPFMQMLKATGPVVTPFVGWVWGVEHPTPTTVLYTLLIVGGRAGGERRGDPLLVGRVRVPGRRRGLRVAAAGHDPAPRVRRGGSGWTPLWWRRATEAGLGVLLLNASVVFFLNVSSVLLIGKTSGLALVLTGIFKSILLVAAAVALWGTPVAGLQLAGYGLALLGLLLYQSS